MRDTHKTRDAKVEADNAILNSLSRIRSGANDSSEKFAGRLSTIPRGFLVLERHMDSRHYFRSTQSFGDVDPLPDPFPTAKLGAARSHEREITREYDEWAAR